MGSFHAEVHRSSRRNTRWGPQALTAELTSGLKTAITTAMTPEQLDAYALHFRIEELGQQLRASECAPASTNPKRSPSPSPEYDASGRRTNTRQHRYRQRLEDERQTLVRAASVTTPGYQPPRDLGHIRRPTMITEKVYIPATDFPEVIFIGQILGPRGRSLAEMNTQSGAHIVIRGKGSVKEGRASHFRGHRENATTRAMHTTNDQHEPLHCLITADTQEKVKHAKELVNEVIENAASAPEEQNQRKHNQLRQLAVINGTFRDDKSRVCDNCGQAGHRHYLCTMPPRPMAGVICRLCSGVGHVARDCLQRSAGPSKLPPWRKSALNNQQGIAATDKAFEQLMLEIGN